MGIVCTACGFEFGRTPGWDGDYNCPKCLTLHCGHPPIDELETIACNVCGILKIDGVVIEKLMTKRDRMKHFFYRPLIEQLRTAAAEADDMAQVQICDRALDGDADALLECGRVAAARANKSTKPFGPAAELLNGELELVGHDTRTVTQILVQVMAALSDALAIGQSEAASARLCMSLREAMTQLLCLPDALDPADPRRLSEPLLEAASQNELRFGFDKD